MYLRPGSFVPEEIEDTLRGNGQPNCGCSTENDSIRLSRVHASLKSYSNSCVVRTGEGGPPLLQMRWGCRDTCTKIVHHPLGELHYAFPAFGWRNYWKRLIQLTWSSVSMRLETCLKETKLNLFTSSKILSGTSGHHETSHSLAHSLKNGKPPLGPKG